jgi:hypothetical protein
VSGFQAEIGKERDEERNGKEGIALAASHHQKKDE